MKKIFICWAFILLFTTGAWSQDTIRVLAIGNSFSEDAVENYLYDLGQDAGVVFVIGNLYIGGCSLERHWNNAESDKADYRYRRIDGNGTKTIDNFTLEQGITNEKWDYISFQQNSGNSGLMDTYFPYLANLTAYVKGLATNPRVTFLFHQTWAYAANSTHNEFPKYHSNQTEMYNAIVKASRKAAKRVGIRKIVPSGTAIQNGRSSFIGDHFNRDGYHLSLGLGRYTAACTWFEFLSGKSVVGNGFVPASITPAEAFIAQRAAHRAVLKPYRITPF
ncbi:MAG: hypothetical protein BGO34_19735 [Bacteroidia bacterium 44-10]|nr:MAG: hypothetical protein BGO34_19735 [Bacteroidia bacterium 44-10]